MYFVFAASFVAVVCANPFTRPSLVLFPLAEAEGSENPLDKRMSEYFRKSLIALHGWLATTAAPPPEAVTRCFKIHMGMQAYKGFGLFTDPIVCVDA